MVRSKWSCVFPLRKSNSIAFADGDPSVLAGGNGRTLVGLLKPRNNTRRFRPMPSMCFIVVRECAVKWILLRFEFYRDVITSMGGIWIVKTAVVFGPLFVPGTCAIRREIISTWQFPDPKNGCYDICFPRKRPRRPRGCEFFNAGLALFTERFDLSEGGIKSDEDSETQKTNRAAFPHYFAFGSHSNAA